MKMLAMVAIISVLAGAAQAENSLVFGEYGFAVEDLSDELRGVLPQRMTGVHVKRIRLGYPAEQGGLLRGDIIVGVNRKRIGNLPQLERLYDWMQSVGSFTLTVYRRGKYIRVAVKKEAESSLFPEAPAEVEEKFEQYAPVQVGLAFPVLCRPVKHTSKTFYGAGLDLSRRVHDRISLSAFLFTATDELARERFNIWTSVNLGARLDFRSALSRRTFNFFLRAGVILSYVHLRDRVHYASGGFGFSLQMGPEFRLSDSLSLGLFLGWDRHLHAIVGKRPGGPSPRGLVYSKDAFYGGLCLRFDIQPSGAPRERS
jgi:hypothetical protein